MRLRLSLRGVVVMFLLGTGLMRAEIKPEMLPADTYAFLSVGSVSSVLAQFQKTPWGQLVHSSEFAPFWKDSVAKFQRRIVSPLEAELRIRFAEYDGIFDGRLTIVLVPSTNQNVLLKDACVFIAETTKEKNRLKENLSTWKTAWLEAGAEVPTQMVAGTEFGCFRVSRQSVEQFVAQMGVSPEYFHASGHPLDRNLSLWVGMKGNDLILTLDDLSVVEKILLAADGKAESLKSYPAYVEQRELLQEGLGCVWVQPPPIVASLQQLLERSMEVLQQQTEAEGKKLNPFLPNPALLLKALHLETIRSIGVVTEITSEGLRTRFHLSAPATTRQGITRLLHALKVADCQTPATIATNTLSFTRLRINIPQALRILQGVSDDAYPLKELLFLGFEQGFQREVPQVDIVKDIVDRFGDDLYVCEMPVASGGAQSQWTIYIAVQKPEAFFETLRILNANTEKAIGIPSPLVCQKGEGEWKITWPEYPMLTFYLMDAEQDSLKKNKSAQLYPLSLFHEEKSLEKVKKMWSQLRQENQSQESTLPLPFPLNRLNYEQLPSFETCKRFLSPATLRSLQVTPQGLDGTILKTFP